MARKSIYDLDMDEESTRGPISVVRVPGGWVYQNAIGGMAFVPWTKTAKAMEMRGTLEKVKVWRGIGMNPLEHFEAIGEMFYKDTGFLRPGKSEPMESFYEGREEERRKYWEDWCRKMNGQLDDQITAALAADEE